MSGISNVSFEAVEAEKAEILMTPDGKTSSNTTSVPANLFELLCHLISPETSWPGSRRSPALR